MNKSPRGHWAAFGLTLCLALPAPLPARADTVGQGAFFRVDLPGDWTDLNTPDPSLKQFKGPGGKELLSVSTLEYKNPPAGGEPLVEKVRQYMESRRDAENRGAKSGRELGQTVVQAQGARVSATLAGSDSVNARRFWIYAVSNTHRIITFYYEALDMTPRQFEARKKAVLGKVQVAE